jgi:phosphoglycolate phosphatase-like HAD superfamily hydrolase
LIGNPREAVLRLRSVGATVGLGTGNIRAGARLKLESVGIADLFDFANGGFGEDGDTRAEVLENGARMLNPSRNLPVVIIGDTPHDINGAKAINAHAIGVPFGRYHRGDLEAAGADAVIDAIDPELVQIIRDLL